MAQKLSILRTSAHIIVLNRQVCRAATPPGFGSMCCSMANRSKQSGAKAARLLKNRRRRWPACSMVARACCSRRGPRNGAGRRMVSGGSAGGTQDKLPWRLACPDCAVKMWRAVLSVYSQNNQETGDGIAIGPPRPGLVSALFDRGNRVLRRGARASARTHRHSLGRCSAKAEISAVSLSI